MGQRAWKSWRTCSKGAPRRDGYVEELKPLYFFLCIFWGHRELLLINPEKGYFDVTCYYSVWLGTSHDVFLTSNKSFLPWLKLKVTLQSKTTSKHFLVYIQIFSPVMPQCGQCTVTLLLCLIYNAKIMNIYLLTPLCAISTTLFGLILLFDTLALVFEKRKEAAWQDGNKLNGIVRKKKPKRV